MARSGKPVARRLLHGALLFCATSLAQAATPIDGFDPQSVDRFMRQDAQPTSLWMLLTDAQREHVAHLVRTSDTFRFLAVTDLAALRRSLSPEGQTLVATLFGEDDGAPDAHLWQFFFEGSLIYFGHSFADTARVGFYNPVLDGWVLADWREVAPGTKDERFDLVRLTAVTGDTMRNATQRMRPEASWVPLAATKGATEALLTSHRIGVEVFEARYPPLGRSNASDDKLRDEAIVLKGRIGRTARALAQLGADPRYGGAVADLSQALARGDATALAASFGGNDPGQVQRIAGLSRPIRDRLRPIASVTRPQGRTVIFGVPFSGRWVLIASYDDAPGAPVPVLTSLVFVDLAAAEAR